jgi:glycolate oxidase FAD binding subunit
MSASATLTLEQGLARLASIAGPEHVAVRGDDARETIVVSPADVQQVAEVLRFANANGLAVMPSCGGTKLGWGNAVAPDIELSLRRLGEVREHAWQDMTCTVQSGCNWAAMQDQLRGHGQMVALDPLWPDRATVGGIVAANDSGALRLKYGSLRDLIIGMTMVLADGTVARSGGKVVKNVAGYDIHKLMTGSFGTLGVITELNFRLHPVEEHARTWSVTLPEGSASVGQFHEPLRALVNSQIVPSALQLRASPQECAIDVRVAGLPECFDEYDARIRDTFGAFTVTDSAESIWAAKQQIFDGNDALILKVSVLPDEICPLSAELQQWESENTEIGVVAQATGLMTVSIISSPEIAMGLLDRLRKRVGPSDGSVVVLQSPEQLRGTINMWGPDRDSLPLMREIKQRFDPNRILNPGRFVGGI